MLCEERVYTTRKVTDHHPYLSKCDFFNTTYDPTLQPMANFNPGFKFLELPGASLNIVGVLDNNALPQEVEQVWCSDTFFASEFYKNILIPSIEGLAIETKTRANNLSTTCRHSNTLPVYFRIYEDDLPALKRCLPPSTTQHTVTSMYTSSMGR